MNPTEMSNEKEVPTTVVFRKWKGKDGGDIIALFPELNHETGNANRYMVMSYMHIGQHDECDPFLVRDRTVPAKPEEYADLLAELKSIGYIPVVRQKINYRQHIDRARAQNAASTKPDVEVNGQGSSIVTITPMTHAARVWMDENVQSEPWQWQGLSLCVDHRFAEGLIEGMKGYGLKVK